MADVTCEVCGYDGSLRWLIKCKNSDRCGQGRHLYCLDNVRVPSAEAPESLDAWGVLECAQCAFAAQGTKPKGKGAKKEKQLAPNARVQSEQQVEAATAGPTTVPEVPLAARNPFAQSQAHYGPADPEMGDSSGSTEASEDIQQQETAPDALPGNSTEGDQAQLVQESKAPEGEPEDMPLAMQRAQLTTSGSGGTKQDHLQEGKGSDAASAGPGASDEHGKLSGLTSAATGRAPARKPSGLVEHFKGQLKAEGRHARYLDEAPHPPSKRKRAAGPAIPAKLDVKMQEDIDAFDDLTPTEASASEKPTKKQGQAGVLPDMLPGTRPLGTDSQRVGPHGGPNLSAGLASAGLGTKEEASGPTAGMSGNRNVIRANRGLPPRPTAGPSVPGTAGTGGAGGASRMTRPSRSTFDITKAFRRTVPANASGPTAATAGPATAAQSGLGSVGSGSTLDPLQAIPSLGQSQSSEVNQAASTKERKGVLWTTIVPTNFDVHQGRALPEQKGVTLAMSAVNPHNSMEFLVRHLLPKEGLNWQLVSEVPPPIMATHEYYTAELPDETCLAMFLRFGFGAAGQDFKNLLSLLQQSSPRKFLALELTFVTATQLACAPILERLLRVDVGVTQQGPGSASYKLFFEPHQVPTDGLNMENGTMDSLLCLTGSRQHIHLMSSWSRSRTQEKTILIRSSRIQPTSPDVAIQGMDGKGEKEKKKVQFRDLDDGAHEWSNKVLVQKEQKMEKAQNLRSVLAAGSTEDLDADEGPAKSSEAAGAPEPGGGSNNAASAGADQANTPEETPAVDDTLVSDQPPLGAADAELQLCQELGTSNGPSPSAAGHQEAELCATALPRQADMEPHASECRALSASVPPSPCSAEPNHVDACDGLQDLQLRLVTLTASRDSGMFAAGSAAPVAPTAAEGVVANAALEPSCTPAAPEPEQHLIAAGYKLEVTWSVGPLGALTDGVGASCTAVHLEGRHEAGPLGTSLTNQGVGRCVDMMDTYTPPSSGTAMDIAERTSMLASMSSGSPMDLPQPATSSSPLHHESGDRSFGGSEASRSPSRCVPAGDMSGGEPCQPQQVDIGRALEALACTSGPDWRHLVPYIPYPSLADECMTAAEPPLMPASAPTPPLPAAAVDTRCLWHDLLQPTAGHEASAPGHVAAATQSSVSATVSAAPPVAPSVRGGASSLWSWDKLKLPVLQTAFVKESGGLGLCLRSLLPELWPSLQALQHMPLRGLRIRLVLSQLELDKLDPALREAEEVLGITWLESNLEDKAPKELNFHVLALGAGVISGLTENKAVIMKAVAVHPIETYSAPALLFGLKLLVQEVKDASARGQPPAAVPTLYRAAELVDMAREGAAPTAAGTPPIHQELKPLYPRRVMVLLDAQGFMQTELQELDRLVGCLKAGFWAWGEPWSLRMRAADVEAIKANSTPELAGHRDLMMTHLLTSPNPNIAGGCSQLLCGSDTGGQQLAAAAPGGGGAAAPPLLLEPLAPDEESNSKVAAVLKDAVRLMALKRPARLVVAAYSAQQQEEWQRQNIHGNKKVILAGTSCKDVLAGTVKDVVSFLDHVLAGRGLHAQQGRPIEQ